MKSEEKLKRLFALFLRTVQSDRELSAAVENILGGEHQERIEPTKKRAKNRRNAASFDPFLVYQEGESILSERLGALNLEELRDIIAEFAMDPSKLAIKWKSDERIREHILNTVRMRMTKGDAFRS